MTEITLSYIGTNEVLVRGPEALYTWREAQRITVPGAEHSPRYRQFRGIIADLRRQGMDAGAAIALASTKVWGMTWAPGKWCREVGPDTYEIQCSRGVASRLLTHLGTNLPSDLEATRAPAYATAHQRWNELRDYQKEGFYRIVAEGWGRLALATNAGKGAIVAMLADYAWQQSHSVLILCDEKAVYDALQGELREWADLDPYLVKAGTMQEPPPPGITLAMIPTLVRRLKDDPDLWKPWFAQQEMLLLDEADKATAPTWRALCKACTKSRWRAGFSGTFPEAFTYADWMLEDLLGPILVRAKNKELIERGISAKAMVELHGYDATASLGRMPRWDDWIAMMAPQRRLFTYENAIMRNNDRHAFVMSLVRPDTPTAIIVNRIEHGEALKDAFPDKVVFLDGKISDRHRSTSLEAFRRGKFHVLIVTKILDRGTNRLGFAEDVIFASGEGSSRQTLQRIGRGLRRAGGKESLRLVDVIDRVTLAQDEDDKRLLKMADFLHEAGRKRLALYEAEGFQVEVIPHA